MIREPVVAGQFYQSDPDELTKSIKNCFSHEFGPGKNLPNIQNEKIYGVISPHAGYMYSGPPAAHSYQAISSQDIDLAIIIGPNHWGIGNDIAIMSDGQWRTPFGLIDIDSNTASDFLEQTKNVTDDFFSHSKDHSLEVQIPMLQTVFSKKIRILPIILGRQDISVAEEIGNAITNIRNVKKSIIIGSSDFTHYEENTFAHQQDMALIKPILELDVEEFYNVLEERKISACGYGAIASTMIACKKLGAVEGVLLTYATSGDIVGNKESVVGYAAIKFI